MFLLREPSKIEIRSFIADQAAQPFSYAEVGATRCALPGGVAVDHNRVRLGGGDAAWAAAIAAVRAWRMFAIDGVTLCWPATAIEVGATVAILARLGAAWSLNACRIVYTVDEVDQFGFAYGTLPEHAVCGEERFLVERDPAGEVRYDLLAFSRPSTRGLSLVRPFLRAAQQRFAAASLAAMRRAVPP